MIRELSDDELKKKLVKAYLEYETLKQEAKRRKFVSNSD